MMFRRGEKVRIRAYGKEIIERVVWEDVGKGLLLCTLKGFNQAAKEGFEPVCVGFPKSDVVGKFEK